MIKQKGARGGDDDKKFASDTASLQGDVYVWSTGTTGTPGRFYAKVKRIAGLQGPRATPSGPFATRSRSRRRVVA